MDVNELNEFIENYFKKNKTRSAIMLSAPWGSGKSYYIYNNLIPYLKKENDIDCIVISLYGLMNIDDVSKGIFLESKVPFLNKNSPALCGAKIVAKTIVKGVTSFFGIDLKTNEKDLKALYESIDLTNKLIILEDVERTSIDIVELLGYVNNLVEQDNVKVLLVTNEDELVKKHISDNSKYFNIKEKTVSDTIQFHLPVSNAIDNIMNSFSFKNEQELDRRKLIAEVEKIMNEEKCHNLRSLIFACQKTEDILNQIKYDIDTEFQTNIFLSNVSFCLKRKNDDSIKWDGIEYLSTKLGTLKYPLFKFAYDYIIFQHLDLVAVKKQNDLFLESRNKENIDESLKQSLNIIYSYYVQSEEDVKKAVISIEKMLEETDNVPYSEYGKLVNYLIAIKYDIKECTTSIDNCKKNMLIKIDNATTSDFEHIRFHSRLDLESKEAIDELNNFEKQLFNKNDTSNKIFLDFSYSLDNIDSFCDKIYAYKDTFITKRCFAQKLNNAKLIELLKKCNPAQIEKIRSIFLNVYASSNIKDFFVEDKDSVEDLKTKIEELLYGENNFDLIQKKQLKYLIGNLDDIIKKLS